MAPDAQAQMPPGGPNFGPGMQQAQDQQKNPIEMTVGTVEKMLLAIQDETFRPYAMQAIAKLKIGMGMAKQKQPQSAGQPGMAGPPTGDGGGGPPKVPTPPVPGQMPV
jgi:hypothetical protein